MLLLALDTSTPAVTVALHDGDSVVAESTTVAPRRHTEQLMPQVVDVLETVGADRTAITEIAVGVGPGPFTGLRVGIAAGRTLGAVLDLPVRGVCSLDVIAYAVTSGAFAGGPFLVATDARRREVYWAAYDESARRTAGPAVDSAAAVRARHGALPTAGAGAAQYPDEFGPVLEPEYPSAAALARAVVEDALETGAPDPLYLRRPDATPPAGRKSVLT